METLLLDLRYAVRTLVRARGFSIAVIVLFAIGIGATTAMFSVVDALLLKPLPYRDPDRMVTLQEWMTGIDHGLQFSPPDFHSFRERSRSFEVLAGVAGGRWTLLEGESPEEVYGFRTSAEYFQIANGEPLLGRTFSPGEGESGAEVVLSYGLWQRRFGSDPALVGRHIHLDGTPVTVIGVMPKGYHDGSWAELWLLTDFKTDETQRGSHWVLVGGRLKPGVSIEAADAEVKSIAKQLATEFPATNATVTARVERFSTWVVRQSRPAALMLFGAMVVLLLIACANAATLVLARASTRTAEIAIRTALGATRGQIIRQLLTESVLLAIAAGALGLLLAAWGIDFMVIGLARRVRYAYEAGLDGRALAFTFAVSLVTGVAAGLVPALQASRWDLHAALKEGAARATASRRAHLLRNTLVVAEVSLALVLLAGAGTLVKTFARLMNVERGFDTRGVTVFSTQLPPDRYSTLEQCSAFTEAMLAKLRALPGVESVAAMHAPPSVSYTIGHFEIEGRPGWPRGEEPPISFQIASAGYARTLGVRIREGRFIDETDSTTSRRIVVINETMARRFFQGESPIGKRLRIDWGSQGHLDPTFSEIVGIYGDTRNRGLQKEPLPETLFPIAQNPNDRVTFAVRASIVGADVLPLVQNAMRDIDPLQPVSTWKDGRDSRSSFEDIVGWQVEKERFQAALLSVFAAVALVLASVGIFGVVAYSVEQRRSELCIRQALGAPPGHILRLAMLRGTRLVAIGIGVGLVVVFFTMRVVRSLFSEVGLLDPFLIAGVTVLLALIATLASYLPARRATRVSPMRALRGD